MKRIVHLLLLGLVTTLTACSFHQAPVALGTVGPAPHVTLQVPRQGYLVVYSAREPFEVNLHSGYSIISEDGRLLQKVQNYRDRFDTDPVRVGLPAGAYEVTARSAHYGRITVPIIIKERQTTFVYLDGSTAPNAALDGQTNVVKLPDGEIVGWSAEVTAH